MRLISAVGTAFIVVLPFNHRLVWNRKKTGTM